MVKLLNSKWGPKPNRMYINQPLLYKLRATFNFSEYSCWYVEHVSKDVGCRLEDACMEFV